MGYDISDYVDVAERITEFRAKFPDGSLQPVDPTKPFHVETLGDKTYICYAAAAYRTADDQRPGIGVAWEPFPGKTPFTRESELMNAETSAWGRAIVASLAADTKRIASHEEVRNRAAERTNSPAKPNGQAKAADERAAMWQAIDGEESANGLRQLIDSIETAFSEPVKSELMAHGREKMESCLLHAAKTVPPEHLDKAEAIAKTYLAAQPARLAVVMKAIQARRGEQAAVA